MSVSSVASRKSLPSEAKAPSISDLISSPRDGGSVPSSITIPSGASNFGDDPEVPKKPRLDENINQPPSSKVKSPPVTVSTVVCTDSPKETTLNDNVERSPSPEVESPPASVTTADRNVTPKEPRFDDNVDRSPSPEVETPPTVVPIAIPAATVQRGRRLSGSWRSVVRRRRSMDQSVLLYPDESDPATPIASRTRSKSPYHGRTRRSARLCGKRAPPMEDSFEKLESLFKRRRFDHDEKDGVV